MPTQQPESTTFVLYGKRFSIPGDFYKAKPLPDDPPNSIVFEKDTSDATNILMLYLIDKSEAMPFNNQDGVIDSLHRILGENQGIVEVNTGETNAGLSFVYTIVKHLKQPSGVQYILTFQIDLDSNSAVLNLSGFFTEEGITGARDATVYEYAMREGIISKEDKSKWCEDPYSPDFKKGVLLNLSEHEKFDEFFPTHPLSELRRFLKIFISQN